VSPDGKELCFVSENVKEIGMDQNHDLFTIALGEPGASATGGRREAKNITTDNGGNDTNPVYSPDGKSLAFLRQETKFFYAGQAKLMLRDLVSGETKELTAKLDRTCANPQWMPDSKRLAVEIEDRGFGRIAFVSAESGEAMLEDTPVSEHAFSPADKVR